VAKARAVLFLQLLVGIAGASAVAMALAAAVGGVSLRPPPLHELLAACRALLLPEVSAAGVVTLLLGALGFSVIGLAATSAWRQLRASRRFLGALRVVARRPIHGTVVAVVESDEPLAFCAGLLRPQMYVSTGTLGRLREDELQAVVAHERHHARQRDPLRIFTTRVLADALFFLPAARRLGERYAALAELAADRAAVRSAGEAAPLASALLSFEAANPAVVGIAPERVDHLMGERPAWELPVALLVWSFIAVVAVVAVALRVQATASTELNLPLVVTQSCMLAMAVVPLGVGAFVAVRSRLAARRGTRHTAA
jgi:Zn-dependent protease with chaperone function